MKKYFSICLYGSKIVVVRDHRILEQYGWIRLGIWKQILIWCNYPGNCDGMNMRDQSGNTGGCVSEEREPLNRSILA